MIDDRVYLDRYAAVPTEGLAGAWNVVDRQNKSTVVVNGVPQIGLDVQDADTLAECLNVLDAQLSAAVKH